MIVELAVLPPGAHGQAVRHALALDWPGPLCNNGVDPAVRRLTGMLATGTVTCAYCRELLAGEIGPWTIYYRRKRDVRLERNPLARNTKKARSPDLANPDRA
jgi:hypothetical protein